MLDLQGEQLQRALGELRLSLAAGPVTLPLASVSIRGRVADRVAHVTIEQRFRNPHEECLEAVYIFPLAGGAAVSQFQMQVGDRVIDGVVEERGEARRQYQQAMHEGKRAALLEKERDDVFTVQVGNLPPKEEILVRLSYSEKLPFFETGSTEMRLPLVVAPRYIPGNELSDAPVGHGTQSDTDKVPDASRITPPRLAPGFDPQVDLSIAVDIVGEGVSELKCSQHAVQMEGDEGLVSISLAKEGERLNRDFVLRWSLVDDKVKSQLTVYQGEDGASYAMLSVLPPRRKGYLGTPRDVVFVLDRSGSMMGAKMTSAARACSILLHTLEPRDRFGILAFDDQFEWMKPAHMRTVQDMLFAADEAGLEQGDKFLRGIEARGGTEISGALERAFVLLRGEPNKKAAQRRLPIIVLLTDGQVGNEGMILAQLQKETGDTLIFTVGIDTAVNEAFLRRLAGSGGGTASFVVPGDNLEKGLRDIGREIGQPLVVDLELDDKDGSIDKDSITPGRMPDLFAGRAASVFLKLKKSGSVRVRGTYADGKKFEETVKARHVDLPAVAQLWAKSRITDLEDRFRLVPGAQAQITREIVALSKQHSILTRFTAFVVIDHSEIVNRAGERRTMVEPVETPAQWQVLESPRAEAGASPAQLRLGSLAPRAATPGLLAKKDGSALRGRSLESGGPPTGRLSASKGGMVPPSAPARPAPGGGAPGGAAPGGSAPAWGAPPPPPASFEAPDEFGAVMPSSPMPCAEPVYDEEMLCVEEAPPAAMAPPPPPAGMAPPMARQAPAGSLGPAGAPPPMADPFAATPAAAWSAPANAPVPPMWPTAPESAPQQPSAAEVTRLRGLIEAFQKALESLREQAAASHAGTGDVIETLRKQLLEALASSAVAASVGRLQRYLRTAAVDLVSALATDGVTATDILDLLDRQQAEFEQARQDLLDQLDGRRPGFWAASI
jgi:Ca-activated chloride channel family protein